MIVKEHEAFARAVVALAREHKMDSLTLSFRMSATNEQCCFEKVQMDWTTGRHGVHANIRLSSEAQLSIEEKASIPQNGHAGSGHSAAPKAD